jgi:hypothetical protein
MATIQIKVPDWVDRICAWPTVFYRQFKYGYTFRRIYLGEEKWTIVDSRVYYKIRNFKWIVYGTGFNLYAVRLKIIGPNKTRTVYLHREIMNAPADLLVDHRNCDSLDNRKANLRFATHTENGQNRRKRKNATSRFLGVWWDKSKGLWESRIVYNKKRIFLGYFDSEIEAAKAYDEAAKKYFGEFARLNFP